MCSTGSWHINKCNSACLMSISINDCIGGFKVYVVNEFTEKLFKLPKSNK